MVRIIINIVIILSNFLLISQKPINTIQKLAAVCISAVTYNVVTIVVIFVVGFHHSGPNLDYHGLFHIDWSDVKYVIFDGA